MDEDVCGTCGDPIVAEGVNCSAPHQFARFQEIRRRALAWQEAEDLWNAVKSQWRGGKAPDHVHVAATKAIQAERALREICDPRDIALMVEMALGREGETVSP